LMSTYARPELQPYVRAYAQRVALDALPH
jgi:hypothetical protein